MMHALKEISNILHGHMLGALVQKAFHIDMYMQA